MSQARTPTPQRRRLAVAGRRGAEVTPSPKPRPEPETAERDVVETEVVKAGVAEPRRRRLVLALSVALVVFTGIAAGAGIAAAPSPDADLRNTALTDAAATSDLLGQVNKAVETVFSFDFTDTAKTQAAAQNLLRDRAVEQYNQLFEQVRQLAPAQKLVLTTTIRATSVIRLDGDQAQLLVLADQRSTRGDTNQTSNAAAQLTVTATKNGDTWTIGDLTVL
ncbi:MAG: Mce-associated rane protein [Actinomycetota bacterium]|jgi:Mce-associated membrane protein|nr:Mce-associated rane protein [Actinomycetota bacterium]